MKCKNGVSDRRNRPAAGTAFGGGDGGRNISEVCPRVIRKAFNPDTWPVCAKILNIGIVEGESTQGSTFSAEHEPTEGSAFGAGHEPTQAGPWDEEGVRSQQARMR